MQADLQVIITHSSRPVGKVCVTGGSGITYQTPASLLNAGFPVSDVVQFSIDNNITEPSCSDIYSRNLASAGASFSTGAHPRNTVVIAYGQQGTRRRQDLFTPGNGIADKVILDALKAKSPDAKLFLSCYIFGTTENLVDALNPTNTQGLIVDSVKEGPRVRHIDRIEIEAPADVTRALQQAHRSIEAHFSEVSKDYYATVEAQALPPYNPDTVVMVLYRFNGQDFGEDAIESNSIYFIALGDCERPPLCGVDPLQMQAYEKNQRLLASIIGIMQAIRNNRLRIPYGKSKLSLLLKRTYNGEKNNPNNSVNAPTRTLLLAYVFTDEGHAEETFHTLTMAKRVANVIGGTLGAATRDLAVEKWRLEQDIMELKDELTIAKQVYDYKPCIFDQPKPVQNIAEEESKRINAILKKREEAREKQLAEIRAKAAEEAKRIIEEEERKSGMTLAALEKAVETVRAENAELQGERAKKIKEYEKHLEKLRKKKEEEESTLFKLKEEVKVLEEQLAAKEASIEKKRRQLDMTNEDQAKGREAILMERDEVRAQRQKLLSSRRQQREQWIKQIRETNEKVLAQVQQLARERRARIQRNGQLDEEPVEETEEQVREDIESIDNYLPKLISLEDEPADMDVTESIRRQLEEYFTQERETYIKKLEEEKSKKADLEKAVESFKKQMQELQSKVLKDQVGEAMRKEQHLNSLLDQVLQYLCNGFNMYKVNSQGNVRRRFFFLSDDFTRIHACELDNSGMPVSRRQPKITLYLCDVKQVILGCYTPSFLNYSGEAALARCRAEAMRNDGTYNPEATQPLTRQNLGRYNYRSFAFFLKGGKTLELVCDSDSDCEAWILALKRIFNYKTSFEIANEKRAKAKERKAYVAPTCSVPITWGAPFDLTGREGASQLKPDEAELCSDQHIHPVLFAKIKNELREKSKSTIITVYDIRVAYWLDLIRSQALYEYFLSVNLFPPPSYHS